ncbi:phage shock protein A (PspA) family protein [Isoptericola sp. CG 20/1183]|uniref:Phage shock protein A (PspA) family protein n=1 Tax=Isoptericola halotolerans TaxID=300560 RepID=A0ABX5EFL1_9MICO|nr:MULTISPECIES: PspA/IM30 family protein [Isoptericola]PRZ08138.1 phage shock protein A (PspA) family protein [Isoptericola halotolerans]PRZ08935.1 phage shock protein A (PspA) family protein [Isoptericola sp. CG 20/1183]
MTQKQSILGRISQLAKANINAMLDRAEDPAKMIDQLIRDYTNNIAEAEQAIAQTIGNLRLAEQDYHEDVQSVQEWGAKALAASRKADERRSAGDTVNADKFDQLAKVALRKQLDAENEVTTSRPMIEQQQVTVEKLKTGLAQMKDRLVELKSKRDQLVARQKAAEAQQTVQGAISSINIMDPTSELSRFEEAVRREEAQAMGQAEIAASSLESQFSELEGSMEDLELEARLAALKAGTPQNQIES